MSATLSAPGPYSSLMDGAALRIRKDFSASSLGLQDTLHELYEVWIACRQDDWDGFGANAVSEETYRAAYALIDSLPLGFPKPAIGAEPDGQLTLEWHKAPQRTLSVSIDPNGYLHYAGLFGPSRRFGTMVYFSGVPDELIQLVRDL